MHLFSSILFAISANMDNIPIGIAYGIKGIHIGFGSNFIIASMTCLGTVVSMVLGDVLARFVPIGITASMGSLILIFLGLWFLGKSFFPKQAPSEEEVEDESPKQLKIKESLLLALALMVNNMGFGIGGRVAGLPILFTSICTFLCSMLLLIGGVLVGKRCGNCLLGSRAELLSGVIIIGLGIYEFFW